MTEILSVSGTWGTSLDDKGVAAVLIALDASLKVDFKPRPLPSLDISYNNLDKVTPGVSNGPHLKIETRGTNNTRTDYYLKVNAPLATLTNFLKQLQSKGENFKFQGNRGGSSAGSRNAAAMSSPHRPTSIFDSNALNNPNRMQNLGRSPNFRPPVSNSPKSFVGSSPRKTIGGVTIQSSAKEVLGPWKKEATPRLDFTPVKPSNTVTASRIDLTDDFDYTKSYQDKDKVKDPKASTSLTTISRTGFRNTGNSCYFNAVVQSLLSIRPFAHDALDSRITQDLSAQETECLLSLLHILREVAKEHHGVINPEPMQLAIGKHVRSLNNKRQQDAHELLMACLEVIEFETMEILLNLKFDAKETDENPPRIDERAMMLDPVKRNFSFLILKTLVCDGCGDTTERHEAFRDLQLDIVTEEVWQALQDAKDKPETMEEMKAWINNLQYPPTLDDLIALYFMPEQLERTCEKCQHKTATMRKQLLTLPRVFVLQVKRFESEVYRVVKRHERIAVQTELNFRKLLAKRIQPPIHFDKKKLDEAPVPKADLPSLPKAEPHSSSALSRSLFRAAATKPLDRALFDHDDEVEKTEEKENAKDGDYMDTDTSKPLRQRGFRSQIVSKNKANRAEEEDKIYDSTDEDFVPQRRSVQISEVRKSEFEKRMSKPKGTPIDIDDDSLETTRKRKREAEDEESDDVPMTKIARKDGDKGSRAVRRAAEEEEEDGDSLLNLGLDVILSTKPRKEPLSGWGVEQPPKQDTSPPEKVKKLFSASKPTVTKQLTLEEVSRPPVRLQAHSDEEDEEFKRAIALSLEVPKEPKIGEGDYMTEEQLQEFIAKTAMTNSPVKRPRDPEPSLPVKKARISEDKEKEKKKSNLDDKEVDLFADKAKASRPQKPSDIVKTSPKKEAALQSLTAEVADFVGEKKEKAKAEALNLALSQSQEQTLPFADDSAMDLETPPLASEKNPVKETDEMGSDKTVDPDQTMPLDQMDVDNVIPIDLDKDSAKESEEKKAEKEKELEEEKELEKERNRAQAISQMIKEETLLFDEKSQIVATKLKDEDCEYQLVCVVNHLGATASSGHYVSNVWDDVAGEWRCFDDSTVSQLLEEEIFSADAEEGAYMFFFVHSSVFRKGRRRLTSMRKIDPDFGKKRVPKPLMAEDELQLDFEGELQAQPSQPDLEQTMPLDFDSDPRTSVKANVDGGEVEDEDKEKEKEAKANPSEEKKPSPKASPKPSSKPLEVLSLSDSEDKEAKLKKEDSKAKIARKKAEEAKEKPSPKSKEAEPNPKAEAKAKPFVKPKEESEAKAEVKGKKKEEKPSAPSKSATYTKKKEPTVPSKVDEAVAELFDRTLNPLAHAGNYLDRLAREEGKAKVTKNEADKEKKEKKESDMEKKEEREKKGDDKEKKEEKEKSKGEGKGVKAKKSPQKKEEEHEASTIDCDDDIEEAEAEPSEKKADKDSAKTKKTKGITLDLLEDDIEDTKTGKEKEKEKEREEAKKKKEARRS